MNGNNSSAKWLGILVVLQAVTLLSIWGAGPKEPSARADGIPDAGAQSEKMIQEQKATNEKLDKLIALLAGGELKVKVSKLDDGSAK